MSEERKVTSNITFEDARLIFRNFQGKGTPYNDEGKRNFGVLLNDELAEQLAADGWNVKHLKPAADDPEQHEQPWLKVNVKYGMYPPIAVLINSRGKIKLDEDTIGQLDWTRIKNVDLVVRPYNYPASNIRPAGVSAYMKAIYVTIQEDSLEEKYADLDWLDGTEEPEYEGD
jgi:hypothetical protein